MKINVADNPSLASILAKYDNKYEAVVSEDEIYSLEFTDKKFTVYNKYDHTKYAEYDYTYDAETRTFVCIPGGNASGIDKNFELTMSNYYVLSLVDVDTKASYILKKPTSDITDEDWAVLKGKYEATLGSTSYTFDFKQGDTKGEGSFTVTIGTKNCAYTYKYENETGKLLTSIAIDGNDPLSTFTLSVKNATITLSDGSNSVNLTEKKNDINEILKGTYTASFDNSGNGEYEYEITFNDNGTATLKNKNKKRERICSYTYNEETGQLKFTKISGSSSSVGIESKIYVIDGQLTYKGPVMGGSPVFSRNGGNETPDVVEVPEEYIGTWYGVDSYDNSLITVELSATTVKVTSATVTQTFDVQTVKDGTITAGMVTLVLGNNSISYNYSNGFVTCTLSKENPLLGVSTELQGTYEGINPDSSENVTIEVGEKTVKYDGFTYTISSVENGTYKFVDKTAPNFFVLLVVGADHKITFKTYSNATFEIHLKGSSTVVEISEKYIGSWVSADGDTLVITSDGVEYNGEAIEVVSASADAGIEVDNFGTSGVIFFDENGALNFRNGSLYTVFTKNNGSTSDSLIDQYVGVYDGSYDSVLTIYKDRITCESGSDVYEYTITNVTETSIVTTTIVFGVESEFTFVINADKTIIGENDEEFTKRNSSNTPTVEIDESLQGTWKDETNNITLVISASSVNWNDIECTGVAYSEGDLSFNYDDVEYIGGINTTTNKLEIRKGTTEWYTFSKQTPSESNGEVDLSSYAGWYVNGNDQIAVISSGILIGKDTYVIDSKSLVDGVLTIEASLNSTSISVTITGNSLVYNEVTYTKQVD